MKADRATHLLVMQRMSRDPRAIELLTSYPAQMSVLAARAFARRGGFARYRLDVPRRRR
jgi:hypothetical protein